MIQSILKLKTLPKELDATDGIAVAICHHFQYQFQEKHPIQAGRILQLRIKKGLTNAN